MPPKGGTRTDLTVSAKYSYSQTSPYGTGSMFSPGLPIQPASQQPSRGWDFPLSVNTTIRPRAYEPFGFPALRAFANVELVRMAIETRKDQLERLDWQIRPVETKKGKQSPDGRVAALTKFWRKPDGGTPFATWLRLLVEDLLVLDAPTLERRRTRGGELIGLDVIPGDTIHPMVDDTGRRPRELGVPAYAQVIKGVQWALLNNEDLIYAPRNPRPNHNYGFGPVEQIIVTINTILRRQAMQLAYFTEGNQPAGLLVGPEGLTKDQLVELQTWVDALLSGNQAERSKLIWAPGGTKYQAFKDSPLKDDFDEWLARIVAYAFSLPPTPFIKQMNRSTGQTDQDRSMEEGLEPLKLWAKRLIDGVIQDDQGADGLEFSWNDTPEIDPAIQSQIDDRSLRNGSATIDEVRDARGDEALPDGLGSKPMLYTGTGAMTLEQVLNSAEKSINEVEPPTPLPDNQAPTPGQGEPGDPGGKVTVKAPVKVPAETPIVAEANPTAKMAKAAPKLISGVRPKARRHAASLSSAIGPILAKTGDHVGAVVGRKLRGLLKAAPADDGGAHAKMAAQIANALDLRSMDDLSGAAYEDLFEVAYDSGQLAVASVGQASDSLTDQVFQRAAAFAKARAAEMVSAEGDESLIGATRNTIRDTIAAGLDANIGADAIAEAVQASTAFSAERSELIANTEIANANGQGKLGGWKAAAADSGLTLEKYWEADAEACPICLENEAASPLALDDDFPSGDDAEGAHPRCECSTYALPVDQSDGA